MSTTDRLSAENAAEELVGAVPELRSSYENARDSWGDDAPGEHVLIGDVVTPYLMDALRQRDSGDDLDRIFAFVERMAAEDDSLANVVQITICERLGDERRVLARARKLMGPETLRQSEEIERFWCREPPLAVPVAIFRHRILRIPFATRFERWLFWTPGMKAKVPRAPRTG